MKEKRGLYAILIRLIGLVMLGITIPNLTGFIANHHYGLLQLVESYAYFVLVAFIIWRGNVLLTRYIRRKFKWRYEKYESIIAIIFLANLLYTSTAGFLLLEGWQLLFNAGQASWPNLFRTLSVITFSSLLITSINENIALNTERLSNLSKVEQLNIAKAQAELEALKNQIDPHFIFNSLNTLSFLITRNPSNARLYNDTLASVYRYILSNKEKDLVLLKEEIEFVSNYFYLLKIRFQDAVDMLIVINDLAAEDYLIPPISLQVLLENAIKHNDFSDSAPLVISVSISSNYVVVNNAINPKNYAPPASGIGLTNLSNRYKLITNRNIIVENNLNMFRVKLPIINF